MKTPNDNTIALIRDIIKYGAPMKPLGVYGGAQASIYTLNDVEVMKYRDDIDGVEVYAVVPEGTAAAFEEAVLDTNNMEYRNDSAYRFFTANKHRFKWLDSDGNTVDIHKINAD